MRRNVIADTGWAMSATYWDYTLELYKRMTSPVRPDASDVAVMRRFIDARMREWPGEESPRVLVLGVTPEIVGMDWPAGTQLTAVDNSAEMIAAVWPGDIPGQRRVINGNWFDIDPGQPFDFVLADGVFNLLWYPDDYRQLLELVASLLAPRGLLLVRVFCQLDRPETMAQVRADYESGRLNNYSELCFRTQMANQRSFAEGIRNSVPALERWITEAGMNVAEVQRRTGATDRPSLPPDFDGPIELHVCFPTEAEFLAARGGRFRLWRRGYGAHNLAARTPVFAMERHT